jgi:hypothetical protein
MQFFLCYLLFQCICLKYLPKNTQKNLSFFLRPPKGPKDVIKKFLEFSYNFLMTTYFSLLIHHPKFPKIYFFSPKYVHVVICLYMFNLQKFQDT